MRWAEWTHIVDGINAGVEILYGPGSRALATPVLILMTDGHHTESGSPLTAAQNVVANHPELLIYTVSFGDGANQGLMAGVGGLTDGKDFHASDVSQLVEVFRELGKHAGVTLIE